MTNLSTVPLIGELLQLAGIMALALAIVFSWHDWRVVTLIVAGFIALVQGRRLRGD